MLLHPSIHHVHRSVHNELGVSLAPAVEMTSRLAELAGGLVERSCLEELQQWKNLLQQYLDHRQGQSSRSGKDDEHLNPH